MSTLNAESLTLDAAQTILRQFLCLERSPHTPMPENALVRQALQLVAARSDYQMVGICADTVAQASTALSAYLVGLGYTSVPDLTVVEGPVYVKANLKTDRCHVAPYTGTHRGVLVSCQSAEEEDVNETFGHLPLALFDC